MQSYYFHDDFIVTTCVASYSKAIVALIISFCDAIKKN